MKLLEESEHSSSLSEKLRDSSPSNELSFDRRPSLKIGGSDIESADSLEDDVLPPVASVKELAIATAGLAGCQFCWGIQVGYGSKTFEELGMPAAFVSWAWLAGPISGILVQPIVGTISDRYVSKLGKRKPFVLIGLVCVLVSLLLFSHSDVIGQRLGDNVRCLTGEDVVSGDCPVALAFSVISFWLLDFSVNCIQGPVRTMVTDLLPNHQHEQGNSWFSFMASLGNFSANILGSISLVKYLPFFRTQTQALYVIGAILVSLSLIPALITVPNHPAGSRRLIRVDSLSKDPSAGIIATFMKSFREMPRAVRSVLWVQFCSWFAWFTTFMYFTPWLGEFVLQGDPHGNEVSKSTFDKGVRLGNLGLALQSGLAMVVSVQLATCGSCRCPSFVQFLIEKFGLKRVYLISQLIQSIALLCSIAAAMLHSPAIAISLIALTSFSWACTMTIPWAITGKAVSGSENKATILAIMNLSQSTPEIFSALVGFALVFFTGNSTSVLLAGSFAALCGAFFVISKRVGDHQ